MDTHRHLSERIAKMRHDKGMSAAQLARRVEELGVRMSRATLSKLELSPDKVGARPPSVEELLALSYALDASPLALLLPDDGETLSFGTVELDRADTAGWLTHTAPPEGIDPKRFEFFAPPESVSEALSEVAEMRSAVRTLTDHVSHLLTLLPDEHGDIEIIDADSEEQANA